MITKIITTKMEEAEDLANYFINDPSAWFNSEKIHINGKPYYIVPNREDLSLADICGELCKYLDAEAVFKWADKFNMFKFEDESGDLVDVMVDGSIKKKRIENNTFVCITYDYRIDGKKCRLNNKDRSIDIPYNPYEPWMKYAVIS